MPPARCVRQWLPPGRLSRLIQAILTTRHPIYYAGVAESIGTIDAYNRQSCLNMIESLYGFKEAEYFVEEEVGPDSPLHLLRQLAIAQCLQDNRPSEVRYTDAKRRKLDSIAYKIMFGVT